MSNNELQDALNAFYLHETKTEAANALEIPRSTFNDRLNLAVQKKMKPTVDPKTIELKNDYYEKLKLQQKLKAVESQIKEMERHNLTTNEVRKHIFHLSKISPDPPNWLPKEQKEGVPGVPILCVGDLHWEEQIDPVQISNYNAYNIDIGKKRMERLAKKTVHLCKDCLSGGETIPGIVVPLLGDMFTGDIHDELSATNELPILPAYRSLFETLITFFTHLADNFGRVFIPCVIGNHTRLTKKKRFKNQVCTSFDWLLYTSLETHFNTIKDDRIQFYVADNIDAFFTVYSHRYCITHGHDIGARGGDGIIGAIGPIMRGDLKIRRQAKELSQGFDTLIMGHWHTPLFLPGAICNGTLKGYDEFAHGNRMVPTLPTQNLFFSRPDGTIVWPTYIYLNETEARKNREWLSWPQK